MKNSILDSQIAELKKLSFDMLYAIACSEDPLTYSLRHGQDECQVEVFFRSHSDELLRMVIALSSDGRARFKELSEDKVREVAIERSPNDSIGRITSLDSQIAELKKLSFDMLYAIACSEDPLTYSLRHGQDECQVEVDFSSYDEYNLKMVVSLDDGRGRFKLIAKDQVKEVAVRRG